MYYYLQPLRPMQAAEIRSRILLERLREDPTLPVERLAWVAATRAMDDDVLRVALSHGAACRQGLLVDLVDLGDLEGGDEIRRNCAEFKAQQAKVAANDDVLEELMPGWKALVPDVDRELDESMEKSAQERDQWRQDLLAMPPIRELAEHWRSLGGRVPSSPA
ncbi:MAG: hypothetical protein ABR500_01640 [Dermatophilaceae bacterium]|nr:hypothetical protein [Intrasporangiaceae bacterium]